MEIHEVKISEVKSNPNNPRLIKDDKFQKLVQSIKLFYIKNDLAQFAEKGLVLRDYEREMDFMAIKKWIDYYCK